MLRRTFKSARLNKAKRVWYKNRAWRPNLQDARRLKLRQELRRRGDTDKNMSGAVLFDWDGTIANSRRAIVASFQKTLNSVGVKVEDIFIEKRIGIGAINTFKQALEAAGKSISEEILEELLKQKIVTQISLCHTVTLFDGAIELLDSLYNRVEIGLASMNSRKIILNLLGKMNLTKYFQAVVTADEVDHPKPSPDIFLKCASELRCLPSRCVVVEDSVFGVEAAHRAGMKCISVPTGAYTRRQLEKMNPDLVVSSLKERQEISGFIFRD